MPDELSIIWAGLHVETGLSRADFEEMDTDGIEALRQAITAKRARESRRDANLFALMCNLHAGGKKSWKPEDFLPKEEVEITPEMQSAIDLYNRELAANAAIESLE